METLERLWEALSWAIGTAWGAVLQGWASLSAALSNASGLHWLVGIGTVVMTVPSLYWLWHRWRGTNVEADVRKIKVMVGAKRDQNAFGERELVRPSIRHNLAYLLAILARTAKSSQRTFVDSSKSKAFPYGRTCKAYAEAATGGAKLSRL